MLFDYHYQIIFACTFSGHLELSFCTVFVLFLTCDFAVGVQVDLARGPGGVPDWLRVTPWGLFLSGIPGWHSRSGSARRMRPAGQSSGSGGWWRRAAPCSGCHAAHSLLWWLARRPWLWGTLAASDPGHKHTSACTPQQQQAAWDTEDRQSAGHRLCLLPDPPHSHPPDPLQSEDAQTLNEDEPPPRQKEFRNNNQKKPHLHPWSLPRCLSKTPRQSPKNHQFAGNTFGRTGDKTRAPSPRTSRYHAYYLHACLALPSNLADTTKETPRETKTIHQLGNDKQTGQRETKIPSRANLSQLRFQIVDARRVFMAQFIENNFTTRLHFQRRRPWHNNNKTARCQIVSISTLLIYF